MNESEIQRLAAAANALRPDWPTASLRTFIANKLADRAYRDAAVAFAWVAADERTKTPARLLEAGPWWQISTENGTPRPPKPEQACPDCGRHRDKCLCDEPPHHRERSAHTTDHITALRAELARVKTEEPT